MINLKNKKPRTPIVAARKLIGKNIIMSFSENKTANLWKSFMPHRDEIKDKISPDFYSAQVYPPGFFEDFNPKKEFGKIAAVAVSEYKSVPEGMKTFELPGGLYAVFEYKGKASEASDTFEYIYYEWFPKSKYDLDNHPHFEILGNKYKNEDPESEEEIWIPIRRK